MRRVPIEKRPNATRLVQSQGLVFANLVTPGGTEPYWPDDRYYSFTSDEVALLETAAKEVFAMCCEALEYLVEHQDIITGKMAVPAFTLKQVIDSWEREPAWGSIYGRFDVCFGGLEHPDPRLRVPKFYEFNADTPTSLVEAASIQWLWLEQTGHGNDQFNHITEMLIEGWKRNLNLVQERLGHKPTVHFAVGEGEPTGEDASNAMLLMDTCHQAGWQTKAITMEEICRSRIDGRFYDQQGEHIDVIFKLYPWEYMVQQKFGEACFKDMEDIGRRDEAGNYVGGTVWIEAPYKLLWSNKALFAILWELFHDDPRSKWLLPTYFDNEVPATLTSFARKPIFSREGADVVLKTDGEVLQDASAGYYGSEGYIVQELALLPDFKDAQGKSNFPVLGLWFVDGDPVGMGIREDRTPITTNASLFVPHSISDGPINYQRQAIPDAEEIEEQFRIGAYEDGFGQRKRDELIEYIKKVTAYVLLGEMIGKNNIMLRDTRPTVMSCVERAVQCLILGEYSKSGPYALEAMVHYVYVEMLFHPDSSKDILYLLALEVNLAKRMGYHRDPSHFAGISLLEAEMRRRLWVTIILVDVLISSQIGMPRMVVNWQWDTTEPQNLHDIDIDPDPLGTAKLPPAQPETEHTTVLGVIARKRMLVALGAISDLTAATEPCSYAEVMRVDGILHEALTSIPPPLRMRSMTSSMTDPPQLIMSRLFLGHMFHKGRIMLPRRFLRWQGDATVSSRKTCLDASLGTLQIQHILDEETRPGAQLQMMRWPMTSIMNHQFLTATMILCMLLQRGQTFQRDEEIKES